MEEPRILKILPDYLNLTLTDEKNKINSENNIPPILEFSYLDKDNLKKEKIGSSFNLSECKANRKTGNMIIKGQTFQNVIPYGFASYDKEKSHKSAFILEGRKLTFTGTSGYPTLYYKDFLFKPNTKYTLCVNVLELSNMSGNDFCLLMINSTTVNPPSSKGYYKTVFTTPNEKIEEVQTFTRPSANGKKLILENLIILEGDWTDKEVPMVIDGIESVGEKEHNLITVKSIGENLKEDRIEIQLDEPLRSLPNGIYDEIVQKEDGIYLIRRIKKVIITGVENYRIKNDISNDNIITFTLEGTDGKPYGTNESFLCDNFLNKPNYTDLVEGCWCDYNFTFTINRSELVSADSNGFKQWLQANPTTIYYVLATPIETKLDLYSLKSPDLFLETYKGDTELILNNKIKPFITCNVPISINVLLEQLEENNKILKEKNEILNNELNQANEELENSTNEQIAMQLDIDMRLMMLELNEDE